MPRSRENCSIACISASLATQPQGLEGEEKKMARVRASQAANSLSRSSFHAPSA